jgi:hypothetical protein
VIQTGDHDGDGKNDSYREFFLEYSDFQHAYEAGCTWAPVPTASLTRKLPGHRRQLPLRHQPAGAQGSREPA